MNMKMFVFVCLCAVILWTARFFIKAQKKENIEETENYPVFNRIRATKERPS